MVPVPVPVIKTPKPAKVVAAPKPKVVSEKPKQVVPAPLKTDMKVPKPEDGVYIEVSKATHDRYKKFVAKEAKEAKTVTKAPVPVPVPAIVISNPGMSPYAPAKVSSSVGDAYKKYLADEAKKVVKKPVPAPVPVPASVISAPKKQVKPVPAPIIQKPVKMIPSTYTSLKTWASAIQQDVDTDFDTAWDRLKKKLLTDLYK